jgi:ribosome-associated protein
MTIIEITQEPVELFKLLKFESIVSSCGEAKHVISEGYVSVNGELETRKRKKMKSGDTLEFNGQQYILRKL